MATPPRTSELNQVTINNVKELLFQQLPATIRHALGKVDLLTPKEVAVVADVYFDRDGRELNTSQTSGLSSVGAAPSDWDPQVWVHPDTRGPKI